MADETYSPKVVQAGSLLLFGLILAYIVIS